MIYMYIFTITALVVSIVIDRKKSLKALKIALKKLLNILPGFFQMLLMVSILLYLIPDHLIIKYLGASSKLTGIISGLFFGSLTLMPGFIAFPLGGILLGKGVSYMSIAAFTTTLMNVGVMTYPVEKEYFGIKLALLRNIVSFLIAVIVTLIVGIMYGEVF